MNDAAQRARMIAETVRSGVPHVEAAEIVDLGAHAFDEAMAAAQRVTETAGPGNRLPIFVSVLASFTTVLRTRFPEHWAALLAVEPTVGQSTVIIGEAPTGEVAS